MKKASVKFNFLMNIILTMSSIVFPLITYPYVSRILMPDGMGKITFATSVVSYFILFAQLGVPTYGIRACAKVRDDKNELSKVTKELFVINLVTTFISVVAFLLCVFLVDTFKHEKSLYIILGSTIILNSLGMEWLFRALEQYKYISIRSLVFKIIAVIFMFLFVHTKGDYKIYAAISVLASSGSYIFNIIYARKIISLKTEGQLNFKRHFKPVLIFFAMVCATSIYTHLDTIMLGIMKDDAEVGYYGSAVKIKTILLTIVTSIGTVLLPRVSYDYQNGEMEEFWRLIKKSVNFILVISLPMTLFFVLFSKPSILLLSGQDYLPAVIPMGIITPTIIIVGLSNITGIQLLLPFGKEKIVLYSEITGAVVDFTINLILIPKMGVVGAAIGTLVAEIVVLLFQCVYLRKDLKHIFVNSSYLKILIGLLISTISIIWVFNLNLSSILTLLIGASIFFAVYFIIMLLEKEAIVVEMVSTFFLTIKKKNGAKQ